VPKPSCTWSRISWATIPRVSSKPSDISPRSSEIPVYRPSLCGLLQWLSRPGAQSIGLPQGQRPHPSLARYISQA
jgi:hypothetical protein